MNLTDKARGLRKQAILGGLVASHVGQNLIGRPIAKSKWFKKDVMQSGLAGATGRKSPRSAKTYSKDVVMGVAAPEVNAAKNTAYSEGRNKAKQLHNEIRKNPEYKAARKKAKATGTKLSLPVSTRREIVKQRKKAMDAVGATKKDLKEVQKLPKGNRAPSSTKAAVGANVALAAVPGMQSTALVNAGKLATGTTAFSKSKVGKKLSDSFVSKPLTKALDSGVKGGSFSKAKYNMKSIGLNPFTAEAERMAHKVGKDHPKSVAKAKAALDKAKSK